MAVSHRERTAHVARRLGVGANASLVAESASADELIARLLSVGRPPTFEGAFEVPRSEDDVEERISAHDLVWWWVKQMAGSSTPLLERMVWFWHDHFATSQEKVENTYLMWDQHLTLRRHALGNFRDLLVEVAKGGAMLRYLDGVDNNVEAINENFGRELMELHTMGIGNYSQDDVVAVARACTGWMINEPNWDSGDFLEDVEPWRSFLDSEYHDGGLKTVLGVTGHHGIEDVIDIILSKPITAKFVATKLFIELVGLSPGERTAGRLGQDFARTYEIIAALYNKGEGSDRGGDRRALPERRRAGLGVTSTAPSDTRSCWPGSRSATGRPKRCSVGVPSWSISPTPTACGPKCPGGSTTMRSFLARGPASPPSVCH